MCAPGDIADYSDAAIYDFILHIASLTKTSVGLIPVLLISEV
jgi:hypothetical protein